LARSLPRSDPGAPSFSCQSGMAANSCRAERARNRFSCCLDQMRGIKFVRRSYSREKDMFRKVMLAALVVAFAGGSALAQDACESKAVGKDGKPLAGAAKTSFMKKCMADQCATKAVSSDGKPLSGAAKTSFLKKCEKGA
jgi:hypothetical protein